MTSLYDIEPGVLDLRDEVEDIKCPRCNQHATERTWDVAEGAINSYRYVSCMHCGYFKGHDPKAMY